MFVSIAMAALAVLLILYFLKSSSWKNMPPGPPVYPLAGSFPSLSEDSLERPYAGMHKLSEQYGEVMSIGLGTQMWVILSGFDSIKQFCMLDEGLRRPFSRTLHDMYSFEEIKENLGIIMSEGPLWQHHRKFMTKTLKEMGVGKHSINSHINQEFLACCDHLSKLCSENSLVKMDDFFDLPSLNVIWQLVCGKRFNYEDEKLKEVIKLMESFTMEKNIGPLVGTSFLKYIPPFSKTYNSIKAQMNSFKVFMKKLLEKERQEVSDGLDPNQNYIKAFFDEREISGNNEMFSDKQLIVTMIDFFTGGSGTMSKTMSYGILYMIYNPAIQAKVQEELDEVLESEGSDLITLDMKPKLPYFEAIISEVQRLASVLPIAPPRVSPVDVVVGGYTIKKNIPVQCNLYSLHRNSNHFKDPLNFDPNRFLTADGKYKPDEWLQPFGYGKRKCLGESVAKSTIFLFLANLLAKFTFEMDKKDDPPSVLPVGGLTIGPQPFNAIVSPRNLYF